MANIALPSIEKDLDFDDGSLQWILTAYSLTVSVTCCRMELSLLIKTSMGAC